MRVLWLSPFLASAMAAAAVTCPPTHGSNVTLTSGSSRYVMPVPANQTQFNVLGPDQQLGCIQIGAKYSMCGPCNFPVNEFGVAPDAGLCSFKLVGRDAPIYAQHSGSPHKVSPPAQILEVTCGLRSPASTDNNYDGLSSTSPSLLEGEGRTTGPNENTIARRETDSQSPSGTYSCNIDPLNGVMLNSDYRVLYVFPPADNRIYDLSGDGNNLGCAQLSTSGWQCYPCSSEEHFRYVNVPAILGTCSFYVPGLSLPIVVDPSKNGGANFDLGRKTVKSIACGYGVTPVSTDTMGTTDLTERGVTDLAERAASGQNTYSCDTGGREGILLMSKARVLYVYPRPDKHMYGFAKFHQNLGCITYSTTGTNCWQCSELEEFLYVEVPASLGTCLFYTYDYPGPIIERLKDTNAHLENRRLQGVTCGWSDEEADAAQHSIGDTSLVGRDILDASSIGSEVATIPSRDVSMPANAPNPVCDSHGRRPIILIGSTGIQEIYPPGDKQEHLVLGANAEIWCYGIWGDCAPCDVTATWYQAFVPPELNNCYFYPGDKLPITVTPGEFVFPGGTPLKSVACG